MNLRLKRVKTIIVTAVLSFTFVTTAFSHEAAKSLLAPKRLTATYGMAKSPAYGARAVELGGVSNDDVERVEYLVQLVNNSAVPSINQFWTEQFAAAKLSYTPPRVIPYYALTQTPCGTAQPMKTGPFYCPQSNTIYYDAIFIAQRMRSASAAVGQSSEFAAVTIIAHEWGHAVQRQLGLRFRTTIEMELQADALAGAFARWAYYEKILDPWDIPMARYVLATDGDTLGVEWYDSSAHGKPEDRVNAFLLGYNKGLRAVLG